MTRIALFQSNTGIDPEANAGRWSSAIGEAAAGGAAMLFTPEMSGLLDRDSARARGKPPERGGRSGRSRPAARRRASTASGCISARSRCWPRTASSPIAGSSSTARARSARATTRSICSTSICRPAKAGANRRSIVPGDGAVVVNGTPVGKLGLTICYDLRFPDAVRAARRGRRGRDLGPGGVHRADRQGALARAAARAGDRGRAVRRRRGAGRASRGRARDLRPFAGRRSVGRGAARHGRASRASDSPRSTSRAFPKFARAFRR